ncbi:MAG: hypothetical protein JNM56_14505 [Planctomycetia bacterium]|nr:hypothetical protein [Planctomycetia bacterium]
MDQRDLLSALLKEMAKAVRDMSDEDLAALRNGELRIQLTPTEKSASSKKEPLHDFHPNSIVDSLRQADAFGAGLAILERECATKEHLLRLARELDLPAEKRDTVERLRERIVDATIGFRLRSQAIQSSRP